MLTASIQLNLWLDTIWDDALPADGPGRGTPM
jgi:hypothetical protein